MCPTPSPYLPSPPSPSPCGVVRETLPSCRRLTKSAPPVGGRRLLSGTVLGPPAAKSEGAGVSSEGERATAGAPIPPSARPVPASVPSFVSVGVDYSPLACKDGYKSYALLAARVDYEAPPAPERPELRFRLRHAMSPGI